MDDLSFDDLIPAQSPSTSAEGDTGTLPDLNSLEQKYNLPSGLLSSVMHQESGGDPNAISDAGAQGLFQFMPRTAKQYGIDPFDPNQAAEGAARMYSDLSKKYNGDVPSMLAGYNWGQGNVDRKGLANAPKETRNYINSVMGGMGSSQPEMRAAPLDLASDNFDVTPSEANNISFDDLIPQGRGGSDLSFDDLTPKYSADPARAMYQATMGHVAKPINDMVSGAMSGLKNNFENAAQNTSNATNSTDAGQWVGDKLLAAKNAVSGPISDAIDSTGDYFKRKNFITAPLFAMSQIADADENDLERYNPDLGKDVSAFEENAKLAGNIPLIKGARSAITSITQPAADSLAVAKSANAAAKTASTVAPYSDLATHSAISDSYGSAKDAVKPYYKLMQDIGAGETADASELKPALDSMISDIQNTPFHEATSELPYLRQQAAKIGENGTMPLNDMVKLKQNLNSNFNPKRFAQGIDTPYSKVGSLVDDSLADAGQRIPEFSAAKSLADKQWLNTIKSPFEDNSVLQKFWKPEDYYAQKSVASGMLEDLPDPTKQRAASMVSGIKTPVQLNAIRRVLPQDMADSLSQAKIQHITQGESAGRLGSAGKAVTGALDLRPSGIANTARNLANVISPRYTPEQQALIKSAKSSSPALSKRYTKDFQQLKAQIQQMKDSSSEMQPVNYPKYPTPNYSLANPQKLLAGPVNPQPVLALPSPEKPWIASPRQPFAKMSDEDYARSIDPQNSMGLTAEDVQPSIARNDPRTPTNSKELAQEHEFKVSQSHWDSESDQLASQGLTYKQIINKIGKRPESFRRGGIIQGFAKGGIVNLNPTSAQKEAGNYKKHHIKLHGMDIAIENPKGSIRSGKDKTGKEWQVKMPAHYGYFKGTTGRDGDAVDVYVGEKPHVGRVYMIHQVHDHNGKFDEHKAMLGFSNKAEALDHFKRAFSDGKGSMRIGSVKGMSVQELKDWLKKGNTRKQVA